MLPRNLFSVIGLGALAVLALPFAFVARGAGAARRLAGSQRWSRGAKTDVAQWTPELLKQLEWRRFKALCAAYFEALDLRAEVIGSAAGSAVDIRLYQQGVEQPWILVQCQPWNAYRVGIKPVRDLLGAMASAKVGEGVLVTAGKFTPGARDFARKETTLSLIDGAELLAKFASLPPEKGSGLLQFATEGDFSTPTCPSCDVKMIPRKSTTHGRKFWGCRNYPSCKQTFSNTL
jgi:restriction system protein